MWINSQRGDGIEATHFDLTVADSLGEEGVPPEQDAGQASDTESVRRIRRRRLVLRFDPDLARDVREGPHKDEDEPSDGTGVPLTSSVMVGLESLDEVNLESAFEIRGSVMKAVPKFMRGVSKGSVKTSLQAILRMLLRWRQGAGSCCCCCCPDCSSPGHHAGVWCRKDV